MKTMYSNKLLVIAVATLALASGYWFSTQFMGKPAATRSVDLETVTVFPASRPLPELTLIDQDNKPFDFSVINGQWSLLFMGFTNCGHICPMTMAELRAIHDSLPEPINVIFVSVDPGRDTPEIIRNYVRRFDDTFIRHAARMVAAGGGVVVVAGGRSAPLGRGETRSHPGQIRGDRRRHHAS